MTPKDKAKQLTLKFMKIDSDSEHFVEFKIFFFYAQRCALIAVDEVIENLVELSNGEFTFIHNVEYWQEVKQEIQEL